MTSLDRRTLGWAGGLALLAGYVDALGFIELGGIFVSFMSGNTTKIGIATGVYDWTLLIQVGSVVFLFVVGIVVGSIVAVHSKGKRWSHVLYLVAGLLSVSAICYGSDSETLAMVPMVLAMGAANTVLRRDSVTVGLTYMTGNLVRMGHSLADKLMGEPGRDWARYLILWVALATGAALGAVSYRHLGMQGLWIGATGAIGLSVRRVGQ